MMSWNAAIEGRPCHSFQLPDLHPRCSCNHECQNGWMAAIGPNWLNSSCWPTKDDKQQICKLFIFPTHGSKLSEISANGDKMSFFSNPDPANLFARTDFDFDNFIFRMFGSQIPRSGLFQAWAGRRQCPEMWPLKRGHVIPFNFLTRTFPWFWRDICPSTFTGAACFQRCNGGQKGQSSCSPVSPTSMDKFFRG